MSVWREYFGFLNLRKFKDYFAKGQMDYLFLGIVLILLTVGFTMMASASYSVSMTDAKTGYDPYYYMKRQLLFALIGLAIMVFISKLKYDVFRDFAFFVFLVSFILLIVVLVSYVELVDKPDIKRWLSVPFVGQFQPSEVAKLGLILFFAWDMERNRKRVEKSAKLTLLYGSIIFVMCVLVFKENHLSGTVLMLSIGCVMVYLGGVRLRWVILVGGALLLIAAGVLTVMWLVVHEPEKASALLPERVAAWGQEGAKVPYMIKRIISWLDKGFEPLGARWQTNQSLFALGSGGLTGKGFGNSLQKHGFSPEAQNDFIFAIVGEELGFIGALLIVGGFLALIFRGFQIAVKANNRFSNLMVMGIVFQLGLQTALSIAVVTDTVPNTGIGLPFFSYGGSSLVIILAEMGMVLSVSRDVKLPKG